MSDPYVPTLKLRFVLRVVKPDPDYPVTQRFLQQWWAPHIRSRYSGEIVQWPEGEGEWRDVPLESV